MSSWPNKPTPALDPSKGGLFKCAPNQQGGSSPILKWVPPIPVTTDASPAVAPTAGDDLSPPNAVLASRMNGISLPLSASAGWSESPPQQSGIFPSSMEYQMRLVSNGRQDSLHVSAIWEYANPRWDAAHGGESMMVKVSIAKTLVQEETNTSLDLVATRFAEFVKNQWVDITTDVDYTQTAAAVVDAVLKDPTANQTAGMATVKPETIELVLGPFSEKARLELTFQVQRLYSYDAMSTKKDGSDIGSQRLVPLWINIPFAPIDNEAGLAKFSVSLQAPSDASILPLDEFPQAYQHVKTQPEMASTTMLAVTNLVPQPGSTCSGFHFTFDSLPIRSCGIMAWLALPNQVDNVPAFDFVNIGRSLEAISTDIGSQQAKVIVQAPVSEDLSKLQVPLPGFSPPGSLWRLKVKTPEAQPRTPPSFFLHIQISDKSGSTGCRVGASQTTMRQRFNELAEARFLKRLESIPALVAAGVLRMDDVLMEVFLAFDHSATADSIHRVVYRVADIHDEAVQCVQAMRCGAANGAKFANLSQIANHVAALRRVVSGGATDFSVAPKTLMEQYNQWLAEAKSLLGMTDVTPCTFVEFDTDGGHNGSSDYLETIRNLCDVCSVRNGVVTGFGSWLNQDCASKVASVLGSVPALLSLEVPDPGTEGLDTVFRRGFSAWISALRQPPSLTLKVSAGHVSFAAPIRSRVANAVEVLAVVPVEEEGHEPLPKFGPPDVSDENYTKTVVEGVPSGKELMIYVVSRLTNASDLARRLEIQSSCDNSSTKAHVWAETEPCQGNFLAYDWLTVLTSESGQKGIRLSPLMATSLASRLEDEVSFRFNLASPSGKTSFLGRSKTTTRAAIDTAHQPDSPKPPLRSPRVSQVGLFGAPAPSVIFGAAPVPCSVATSAPLFGAPAPAFLLECCRREGLFSGAVNTCGAAPPSLFGAPAPTPAFGAAAPSPFGSPAPALGAQAFGAAAPSPFGAPAPAFGAAPSSPFSFGAAAVPFGGASFGRTNKRSPSSSFHIWIDSMAVPMGSDEPIPKPDYDAFKQAIAKVAHAGNRFSGEIDLVCDICQRLFARGEERLHCFDCPDFDTCYTCREQHKVPFHRLVLLSSTNTQKPSAVHAEDPSVSSLLQPTAVPGRNSAAPCNKPPRVDRTMVWCRDRLCRFLKSILHWWPLFRMSCAFGERLPEDIDSELANRIFRSCDQNSSATDLLNTVALVIDSLKREDHSIL